MPTDFKTVTNQGVVAFVRKGCEPCLDTFLSGKYVCSESGGRGTIHYMLLEQGVRAVCKQYKRGGLFGRIIPDLFLGRPRPLAELFATDRAQGHGINVAESLVGVVRPAGMFHADYLVSREIPGATDTVRFLSSIDAHDHAGVELKHEVIRAAAGTVREMHDAGIYHADLNVRNLLVTLEGRTPRVYIVDFDKARLKTKLSPVQCARNILRLNRSAAKARRDGLDLTRADTVRFLTAYCHGRKDDPVRRIVTRSALRIAYEVKWFISDVLYRLMGRSV